MCAKLRSANSPSSNSPRPTTLLRRWPSPTRSPGSRIAAASTSASPLNGGAACASVNRFPLLLIDADLFKAYNDANGHLRGDNCLKQIAEAIQDVVSRPGDLVARFGGEEFAVILPNTPAPGALQLAQDICAIMCNRQLLHSASPIGVVTVSAGSATLVPQLGQHAVILIDCADQALYQAKRSGRNRACAYRSGAIGESADKNSLDLIGIKSA